MVQRTRLLECPSCGKQLEDTKQTNMVCRYCGTQFEREEVAQEDEDFIRRKMIVDLRTDMEIYKNRKKVSIGFMIAAFVIAIPVLLSKPFNIVGQEGIVLILLLLAGLVFFGLMIFWDRSYDSSKSKASDISMRRRL